MARISKRKEALSKIDKAALYTLTDALKLVKEISYTNLILLLI